MSRQHTEREAHSPFSPLVDPRWLSAQGEYMKELTSFRSRLDSERAAATKAAPKVKAQEPKAKAKQKGQPAAKPKAAAKPP